MKKILLAISPSKEIGGAQKLFLITLKEFIKKNYSLVVVLPDESLLSTIKSYNIRFYLVNFHSISCLVAILRILHKEKVDIINTYLPQGSLVFSFVNLVFRTPLCCTLLNAITHEKLNTLQRRIYPLLYFLLYKLCDGIIVNSRQNRQHFIDVGRMKGEHVKVIYSGIEKDEFSTPQPTHPKRDTFIIGTVGRLSREKGQNYLIDALSRLKGVDFECIIVGDGPLRGELEDQVARAGLKEKVTFLGFQRKVAQLIQWMDVVVTPSLNETFGITIVEAFALRKAVIASEVGGIPELVKHKITGLLFPVHDSSALAERIEYLYHNRAEIDRMGQNAYDFFMNNFTSSIMAENTLAYYDTLIKREQQYA
ncbi:MAG: glycosyltransferase [bacterium]